MASLYLDNARISGSLYPNNVLNGHKGLYLVPVKKYSKFITVRGLAASNEYSLH